MKESSIPNTLDVLSKSELETKLKHSYEQALKGECRDLDSVFKELLESIES